MGDHWLRCVLARDDVELVGLVDVSLAAARAAVERHGLDCPVHEQLEPAVREGRAELVLDVVVPEARQALVLRALELGCHVFGEKPMATSLGNARELVHAAARSGRTYAVMQNRRYNPGVRALRELVAGGAIGTPGFACADFFIGPHFGGFRDTMPHPLLVDMAIHTFDASRFVLGSDAVAVHAHEFNTPGSWFAGDASAVCTFELATGSIFAYRGSWSAEGCPTSWESSWRVVGSRGTAVWDGEQIPFAEVVDPASRGFLRETKRVEGQSTWSGRSEHAGCLDEMFVALHEGRKPETDCSDNFHSVAMMLGALESARSGRRVEIDR